MFSTLPEHPRPPQQPPEEPERRGARRSRGQQPLPALVIGLIGALTGILLVLLVLLLSQRLALTSHAASGSENQDKGFLQPYEDDPEVNQESDPSYALPQYQGDASGLTIDFTEHSGTALTAAELYEQQLPATVSLTVYAGSSAAYGSGMMLTPDGFLLTCAHVVADAQSCTVALTDGRSFEALLVASDAQTDLAVLKIDAQDLPCVRFFDSDQLVVGEDVYSIGDPVRPEFRSTLTSGIVSGLNRQVSSSFGVMRLIQTTAPINSGNSGGPLFNAWGQVIGVVNMKLSRSNGGTSIENMGMAIPSRTVKSIVEELVQNGSISRAVLGISCQSINEARAHVNDIPEGLWVTTIDPNSDVANHDIQVGDIITAVNGTPVQSVLEFRDAIDGLKAGESVRLTVWRDDALVERLRALQEAEDSSAQADPESDPESDPGAAAASSEALSDYHFRSLGEISVKLVPAEQVGQQ